MLISQLHNCWIQACKTLRAKGLRSSSQGRKLHSRLPSEVEDSSTVPPIPHLTCHTYQRLLSAKATEKVLLASGLISHPLWTLFLFQSLSQSFDTSDHKGEFKSEVTSKGTRSRLQRFSLPLTSVSLGNLLSPYMGSSENSTRSWGNEA